jgi:predicted GNAT family acetyltransferase
MSLAPLMSLPGAGPDARTALSAPSLSLEVMSPADLVGLPSGGLESTERGDSPVHVDPMDHLMEVPFDLTEETNRDLRRWSNTLYKTLDTDFPPFGAVQDYERVTAEIERRNAANDEDSPSVMREKFRDNAPASRFELFRNGQLAGYMSYTMRAGTLRMNRTVVTADFEGMDLEGVLMRNVILMAHKRRLATIPYCPVAQSFVRENPQYRQLMHA